MLKVIFAVVVVGRFLMAAGQAVEWRWDETARKLEARAEDVSVEGSFGFKNRGSKPIIIKSVEGGCSCLEITHSPEAVAPGGHGFVKAKFIIGQRRGLQSKLLLVKTDDPKDEAMVLTLTVDIKEAFQLRPTFVYWRQQEVAKAKTVTATATGRDPIHIVKATPTDPRFTVVVTTVKKGQEYQLSITPKDTNAPASCQIAVETDQPASNPQTYHLFAHVKAPADVP